MKDTRNFFWDDGNVLYFYCSDSYMTVNIWQSSLSCTLKMHELYCVHFISTKEYFECYIKNVKFINSHFHSHFPDLRQCVDLEFSQGERPDPQDEEPCSP